MTYLQFSLPVLFFTLFGLSIHANADNPRDNEATEFVHKLKGRIKEAPLYYNIFSEKITDFVAQNPEMKSAAENNDFKRALRVLQTPEGRQKCFDKFLKSLGGTPTIMDSKKAKYYFKQKRIKFLLSVAKEREILIQKTLYERMINIKSYIESRTQNESVFFEIK